MGVIENMMKAREARAKSPAFQMEMAKESAEFMSILGNLGNNTLDAGYTTLLKTPTELFLNAFKAMYHNKYGMKEYAGDAVKLFLGKDGVAHSTLKVAANAVHLGGQAVKMVVRQLFAI